MDTKEQLIQGLSDAGCTMEAAEQIGSLYETGSYRETAPDESTALHPHRADA